MTENTQKLEKKNTNHTMPKDYFDQFVVSTQNDNIENVKLLVIGEAGIGKNDLIKTLPVEKPQEVLILSTEAGNQVLKDYDFKTTYLVNILAHDIKTHKGRFFNGDLYEVLWQLLSDYWANPEKLKPYKWIVLDSLSDLAEEKIKWNKNHPALFMTEQGKVDTRAMYGDLKEKILRISKKFLFLQGINKYAIAGAAKEEGPVDTYSLLMEGSAKERIAFHYDDVFFMRLKKGEDGKAIQDPKTGNFQRELVTNKTGDFPDVKCRTDANRGIIKVYEKPDLGYIYNKAYGRPISETSSNSSFIKKTHGTPATETQNTQNQKK